VRVEERERRARSFGGVADAYERGRPEYPAEAVAWLLGEARVVVDLGAGTGKLTRGLVAPGREVVAVEPSEEMAARLREALPTARVLRGSAEEIPLADGGADAVVAGQAYHWFDPPRALPEIARVLRPGGTLGLVWNRRDSDTPWVARLGELLASGEDWHERAPASVAASGLFGGLEEARFRHEQALGRQALLDLALSRSSVAVRDEAGRAAVLDAVGRLYDEAAGPDGIRLPYVTIAYRAARS
jgi:SAM-dependent methyltransferase